MNIQQTRYGTSQAVYAHNGKILGEVAEFTSNGRPHSHDGWEICTVIKGYGCIKTKEGEDERTHDVVVGSVVLIPPDTLHWMEVKEGTKGMVILIGYTDRMPKS